MFFLLTVSVNSQDLEPRVYANVAKNLNVASIDYLFTDGNVLTDPSLPITDFKLQSHNVALHYIRTFGFIINWLAFR